MSRPTVSICTPTYNRRKFIPLLIQAVKNQTYPHNLMEWIVIDDGDDKVEDLFKKVKFINVKYYKYDDKLKLGKKRNIMNSKCTKDVVVYMDDDDYYPADRVKHAITRLYSKPNVKVAGSSMMYIYYTHVDKICSVGPYSPFHATAGTFVFKRELLEETSFEDDADKAEEKHFLKNYSIPLIQLDPMKSILVISHEKNTFDKKQMLENKDGKNFLLKKTNLKLKNFIKKDKKLRYKYKNNVLKF